MYDNKLFNLKAAHSMQIAELSVECKAELLDYIFDYVTCQLLDIENMSREPKLVFLGMIEDLERSNNSYERYVEAKEAQAW